MKKLSAKYQWLPHKTLNSLQKNKVVEALLSCNAASEYKMAGLQHLMKKGVSEYKNPIGTAMSLNVVNTPLHRSAQHGHLTVCWLLIISGFSIMDLDNVGNTPLHRK